MDSSNPITRSFLDKVRLDNGTDGYKKYFRSLVKCNKKKSIQLLNDERLGFSSLFLLRSEIQRYNLFPYMNARNRNTLWITDSILSRESSSGSRSSIDYKKIQHAELRWMFETGCEEDGLNNEFDEVMDSTAILLVRLHKDKAILNKLLEMIYKRHMRGLFIYDLVWAFFESRDPHCLVMIANSFQSEDPRDVELTKKLLSFIPYISISRDADSASLHTHAINWIQENYLFLYYTGESFQQSNNPIPYAVSLDAKYLFKPVSPESGRIMDSLTDMEKELLKNFRALDENSKLSVSNYSFLLHHQNLYWWKTWLNYPIIEQVRIAETMSGGGLQ